jgi:hypothetical protein
MSWQAAAARWNWILTDADRVFLKSIGVKA